MISSSDILKAFIGALCMMVIVIIVVALPRLLFDKYKTNYCAINTQYKENCENLDNCCFSSNTYKAFLTQDND